VLYALDVTDIYLNLSVSQMACW